MELQSVGILQFHQLICYSHIQKKSLNISEVNNFHQIIIISIRY